MKVKDLKKELSIKIDPVYFIVGDDTFLRKFAENSLLKILNKDMLDFNLNTFESPFVFDNIIRATSTMPFMDEHKIVLIKSINKISDINEDSFKKYLKNPEPATILVINDEKNILKKFYKLGTQIDCNKLSMKECTMQAESWFRAKGKNIENGVSKLLCEYSMCDLQKIHNEIDKLAVYKPDESITIDDIVECVAVDTDFKIYEFSQSLANKNADKAYGIMQSLVKSGNQPSALLSAIIKQYRRMFYASISKENDQVIGEALKVKPFAIKMARMTAKKYTQVELKNYLDKLIELEYKLFTGKINRNEVINLAICILIA